MNRRALTIGVFLMGMVFIAGFASSSHAWDWKKCKGPYNKEIQKCNKEFTDKSAKEWNDCFEKAQIKLYECRLEKGRFQEGKSKETLQAALDKLNSDEKIAIEKCFELGKPGSKQRVNCLADYVSKNSESYLLPVYSHHISETDKK